MSEQDPPRLLDSASPYVRSLLRAGESELPDQTKLASLAVKLGPILGGGAGGAGGGGAIATKSGVAAKTASVGAALKIAGGAVLAATLVVTAAIYVPKIVAAPTRSTSPASEVGIAISSSTSTVVDTALPVPTETVAPIATIAPLTARKPPTVIESPDAEVKLLERAQDALRTRPEEAVALCTEHASRFPQGLLSQEREVIAIEALTQTGRLPEAQARAARFAASYPHSTHLRRVETLVGTKF